MLKGDYCLESDLNKDTNKKRINEYRRVYSSALFESTPDSGSLASPENLDSEDEKEIKEYLKLNADHVSFAGDIIKTMAKSGKHNLLDHQKVSELINDEMLRKYKLAEEGLKAKIERKVAIGLPSGPEIHQEIKRRQTGFVRPADLARVRQFKKDNDSDEDADDDDDDDDYQPYTRQVSIQQHSEKMASKQAIDQEDHSTEQELDTEEIMEESVEMLPELPEITKEPRKVSYGIPDNEAKSKTAKTLRMKEDIEDIRYDEFEGPKRHSGLGRLIKETIYEDGAGPTLKDYRPLSEANENKSTTIYLTFSPNKQIQSSNDSRELYLKRRHSLSLTQMPVKSIDHVLFLQHGQKVTRKLSSDYVKTIDQFEQKEPSSLRSLEFARRRPAISVTDYQKKNQEYQESLSKSKLENEPTGDSKNAIQN